MNFEQRKCNEMQIKSKHLCKTSFACRRKILHYLSLSRIFFINFSHSSTVSPERGKSPSPPHDPRAHAFFLYQ